MKFAVVLSALLIAAPLTAETPPAAPVASVALSIDSPIEALVANAASKAVVDANFPGMTAHPAYEQFKGMSLKQLQPMSGGAISDAAIAKAAAELTATK
ncbi:MAG: hypothetical protein ABL918_02250 [Chakrabartia sp.]